ncbi:MAG: hypothetical protein GW913_16730, partial [Myxococcales bacterium]|nr:hypothetical protein [Myxococcales bacterium]
LSGGSPMVSTVVRSVTTNDHFGELGGGNIDNVLETRFAYHDGYYEGIEQEFRGFGAADAINVGDDDAARYQPSQYTRTYFHQGRRPTSMASDRLADNPREALKGRQWRSESFDGAGVTLSTTLAEVRVRKLATGLDGRAIGYGYVGRTDAYSYDTAEVGGFATPVASSYPWVAFDEVSGGSVVSGAEETQPFFIRSPRYALMRSTVDAVDNLGQVRTQTALGRVHGEDDAPGSERDYGEAIVSHSVPVLVNASQWIWRTAEAFVDGHGTSV